MRTSALSPSPGRIQKTEPPILDPNVPIIPSGPGGALGRLREALRFQGGLGGVGLWCPH